MNRLDRIEIDELHTIYEIMILKIGSKSIK